MQLRKTLGAAALITAATMASMAGCSGRDDEDGNTPDSGTCVGTCANDAGTDAGTPDSGTPDSGTPDGGGGVVTLTVREARDLEEIREVILENVVVTGISRIDARNAAGVTADFWVADPANPKDGIFVQKFRDDPQNDYSPKAGDVVTIRGFVQTKSRFNDREGYRRVIKNNFDVRGSGPIVPMTITKVRDGEPLAPVQVSVASGFGNADGGTGRPNQDHLGARVHIVDSLTITNANPEAFKRLSAVPNDTVYYGFEVTGGVLVNNNTTFGFTQDGGTRRCDYRVQINNDAGTITFPQGIKGVWDTFTHAPCVDGGTSTFSCFNDAGVVPGTDNRWTTALYPDGCEDLEPVQITAPGAQ
ncbi:hypothetical protein HPC49_48065 [Pyxidicoccus fallax]|uniref:Lipoprotein n=1 Tax=Pyxidicoccus fallax TaxID=394095 RepID=A0A848LVV7_9BACT|nr:hypothetical protein [Pyxidicoccus fallax]NMO21702.1 hypothetical protein [Pyxidicoccus fallax]NPC85928.1 hypothetical protein [Pyxidicoccus fallax]